MTQSTWRWICVAANVFSSWLVLNLEYVPTKDLTFLRNLDKTEYCYSGMDKNFFFLYCCDRGVYGDVLVMLVRLLPAGTTRQRRCRQTKRRVYIHCGLPPLLIPRATHVTTATLSSSSSLTVRSQINSNSSNAKKSPNNRLLIGSD
jgi:hypothetical protein